MRGLLLFLLLALCLPASARPQVLLVIADHLSLDDVTRPGLPNLARMRAEGRMALMSPGLPQGQDPVANVYATLGAGDSIRVGDVSQGRLGASLRQAGVRTALIGDADGDDTGEYRPAFDFLPFADEVRVGPDDGTVPDPIACGGRRGDPGRLWMQTQIALRTCDLVVVHDGDFARVEREERQGDLLPSAYARHRTQALAALDSFLGLALSFCDGREPSCRLMLLTPTPVPTERGTWDRLTPFLQLLPLAPRSAGSRPLARSDTTQTVGLVSTRDLAPTVLRALGVSVPVQMTGAIIGGAPPVARSEALSRLRRLDRITRFNQDAQDPLFWSLGFGAGVVIFTGLGLYLSGRMASQAGTRRASLFGLRLLSAWPLALLLAPLADPRTLGGYFFAMVALTALIALLPSPSAIYGLTAMVLLADGLTGTRLVSQSVLSAYALSGIRFYGIGNEYMGLLIGGALLAAVDPLSGFGMAAPYPPSSGTSPPEDGEKGRWHQLLRPRAMPRGWAFHDWPFSPSSGGKVAKPDRGLFLWFALVTFVLSYPEFGAKAGGAVTATATFVLAGRGLRGLPVSWKHGLAGVAAGFGLVFLWALMGHWLPGGRHTHIESAVDAVGQGRLGYIAGVALRKVGLALHVLLLPGTLMGVLGLALIAGFARAFLQRPITEYLARHPRFRAAWSAGLWGCLVAVLFNDSGVVAAILLLTSLSAALLHGLYQECALLPSMSAKSASASPSATP